MEIVSEHEKEADQAAKDRDASANGFDEQLPRERNSGKDTNERIGRNE